MDGNDVNTVSVCEPETTLSEPGGVTEARPRNLAGLSIERWTKAGGKLPGYQR